MSEKMFYKSFDFPPYNFEVVLSLQRQSSHSMPYTFQMNANTHSNGNEDDCQIAFEFKCTDDSRPMIKRHSFEVMLYYKYRMRQFVAGSHFNTERNNWRNAF